MGAGAGPGRGRAVSVPPPGGGALPGDRCGRGSARAEAAPAARRAQAWRRRAEQALISVVATAYALGVSTRRVEKFAETLGVTQLSKSQASAMAKHLDQRSQPSATAPWTSARTPSSGSTP
jgi:hypothetical protein